MNDLRWWRVEVVRPALQHVGLWSYSAETLVLGTGLVESRYRWVRQIGGGPALGCWQMEPATHRSLWLDLMPGRIELAKATIGLIGQSLYWRSTPSDWERLARVAEPELVAYRGAESVAEMFWYAAAMARIRYLWDPHRLPDPFDVEGMAATWVRVYNAGGAGTVAGALPWFQQAVDAA